VLEIDDDNGYAGLPIHSEASSFSLRDAAWITRGSWATTRSAALVRTGPDGYSRSGTTPTFSTIDVGWQIASRSNLPVRRCASEGVDRD
jgi:hypothetical protein